MLNYYQLLKISFAIIGLITINPAQAQITSDESVSTKVETSDNSNYRVTNGTQLGRNLFHSFKEFSLPTKGSVFFDNPSEIVNIISRVTGLSPSHIDGLIRANGTANLILINPNGMIFGRNASLNIGGSFLATTASSLFFADGTEFIATASGNKPLLTVSLPIGLQFGATPGEIVNQSRVDNLGLQVQPGKTIALVGGNLRLDGGNLTASGTQKETGGRIELGSVAGDSLVAINSIDRGWEFGYEGVQEFQDIQLSNLAVVDASGSGGGDIRVWGRNLTVTGGSQIKTTTMGSDAGGDFVINATESVQVIGATEKPGIYEPFLQIVDILIPEQSSLLTTTFAAGAAGDLTINTGKLIIRDGAQVNAEALSGSGNGGNITVNATESVEVSGSTPVPEDQSFSGLDNLPKEYDSQFFVEINASSNLSTASNSSGMAGKLTIATVKLIVSNGGIIAASPFNEGDGGNVTINTTDSVMVVGTNATGLVPSTIATTAFGQGNAGNLNIQTQKLTIANGGVISGATLNTGDNAGDGGNVAIAADHSIELTGRSPTKVSSTGLLTQSQGNGSAGNLTINTRSLNIQNGAGLTVEARGDAGNLAILADSIILGEDSFIYAETESSEGGNITLQIEDLLILEPNSEISAAAGNENFGGNGGNIKIQTNFLVGSENSEIIANAFEGRGGNIHIDASSGILFGENNISASSEKGIDGMIEIITPEIDPTQGVVELPEIVLNLEELVYPNLCADGRASEFVITGRGGLPQSPNSALSIDTVWEDWRIGESKIARQISKPAEKQAIQRHENRIVQAQGWVFDAKGRVVLTALPVEVGSYLPASTSPACQQRKG